MPSALLNLQKMPIWGFIPDAWHHQMIYACETESVYLTNPLEIKTVDTINNLMYNVKLWLYEATRNVFWTGVRIPPGPP